MSEDDLWADTVKHSEHDSQSRDVLDLRLDGNMFLRSQERSEVVLHQCSKGFLDKNTKEVVDLNLKDAENLIKEDKPKLDIKSKDVLDMGSNNIFHLRSKDSLGLNSDNIFASSSGLHYRIPSATENCRAQYVGSDIGNVEEENGFKSSIPMSFEKYTMDSTRAQDLCEHYSLPQWMQDNEYLLTSHRPPLPSVPACLRSIFYLHSETINIWTHLLGCAAFIILAINFLIQPVNLQEKIIFGIFFAAAILCLGFSSIFHTLHCHSPEAVTMFSRLDYCGITLLITASYIAWLFYGFYCHTWLRLFYLSVLISMGIMSLVVSLSNLSVFAEAHQRAMRAATYVGFGVSGVIPGLHWAFLVDWDTLLTFGPLVLIMGFIYIFGATLYAFRFPERLCPGSFDLFFQSHQIFHVMVVIATYINYQGIKAFSVHQLSSNNKCT